MKIKLPLMTMLEGLKRGGAIALAYRGTTTRQIEEELDDPCGLIRITASTQNLTFESGDTSRWVSHTVAVAENDGADNPVEVEQEGACCFDIGQLYPVLKTMEISARAPGSAYSFELQHSLAGTQPPPQVVSVEERSKPCGHLDWVASEAGDRAGSGNLCAFPSQVIQRRDDPAVAAGMSANPPTINSSDEFVWEVEAKAIKAALALLSSVKVRGKHDPALAEIGLAIQHGCGFFFCATKATAVVREITPSEIIDQDKLEAKFPLSSDGLNTLASVLAAATERQSSSYAGTIKLFLLHDQQTVRFEVGTTNLFAALHHTEEQIASADPVASINLNLSALLVLRPEAGFTVDTEPFLRALEHALSSSMKAQRIDACHQPKQNILELQYAPNPLLQKQGKSMHPATADLRCHDFQPQQPHLGNAAMPIAFSFAPKPVVEFIKVCKCDKVTLELFREPNGANLLRVRPAGNRKEAFICSLMPE